VKFFSKKAYAELFRSKLNLNTLEETPDKKPHVAEGVCIRSNILYHLAGGMKISYEEIAL